MMGIAIQDINIIEAQTRGTLRIAGPFPSRLGGEYYAVEDERGSIEAFHSYAEALDRIFEAFKKKD